MGRPSKPTALILGHRTKAELEYRESVEKTLYTGENFTEWPQTKSDPVAHKEFLRLKRLFSKIQYVDALDQQIINRYCLETSELIKTSERVERLHNELESADEAEQRLKIYALINQTLSAQHKSKELLLKYESKLLLNPADRMNKVPKAPPQEESDSPMAAYLARRETK